MLGISLDDTAGIAGNSKTGLSLDPSNVEVLTAICARELIEAFGLDVTSRAGTLLYPAACSIAYSVARDVAAYDHIVGEHGLTAGGRWVVEQISCGVKLEGAPLPRKEPLLIVANHPGLADTVSLFSTIARGDLRIIAAKRDFLDALPNTASHLFTLNESSEFGVIRSAARHMKDGGSLLTFPGGRIEPDPALHPKAASQFGRWSKSFELFARLVPDLTIVPALVSGVVSKRALRNPVTFVRRGDDERRWLAATIQMLSPKLHPTTVRVEFGRPVKASGIEREHLSEVIMGEMRRLVSNV